MANNTYVELASWNGSIDYFECKEKALESVEQLTLGKMIDKRQNSARTGHSRVSSNSDIEPHLIHGTMHFMNELFLQLR